MTKDTTKTNPSKANPTKLKRAVIKEELVAITGDHIGALIVNQFIYWSARTFDFDSFIKEESARLKADGEGCNVELTHGWIYKTAEDLADELMLGISRQVIRTRIKKCISLGIIHERRNPKHKWDRTIQYRMDFRALQERLMNKGYPLDGYTVGNAMLSDKHCNVQNRHSRDRDGRAIAEITPETTSKREKKRNTGVEKSTKTTSPVAPEGASDIPTSIAEEPKEKKSTELQDEEFTVDPRSGKDGVKPWKTPKTVWNPDDAVDDPGCLGRLSQDTEDTAEQSTSPVDLDGYRQALDGLGLSSKQVDACIDIDTDYALTKGYKQPKWDKLVEWWLDNGYDYAVVYITYATAYRKRMPEYPDKAKATYPVSDVIIDRLVKAIKAHPDTAMMANDWQAMLKGYMGRYIDDTDIGYISFRVATSLEKWMADRDDQGRQVDYQPPTSVRTPAAPSGPSEAELMAQLAGHRDHAVKMGWTDEVAFLNGYIDEMTDRPYRPTMQDYARAAASRRKTLEDGGTMGYDKAPEPEPERPLLRASREARIRGIATGQH